MAAGSTGKTNFAMEAPCAGIIVLDKLASHVVIVSTPRGRLGFTKGKRNRGESVWDCAYRETEEESGLKATQLTLVNIPDNERLIEHSKHGNPSVEYLLATTQRVANHQFTFDETELASVMWMPIATAMTSTELKMERKLLLQIAQKITLSSIA